MREARRNCIYPMSVSEEIQLEQMYHTMLVMVPIVRELDAMGPIVHELDSMTE